MSSDKLLIKGNKKIKGRKKWEMDLSTVCSLSNQHFFLRSYHLRSPFCCAFQISSFSLGVSRISHFSLGFFPYIFFRAYLVSCVLAIYLTQWILLSILLLFYLKLCFIVFPIQLSWTHRCQLRFNKNIELFNNEWTRQGFIYIM